MASNAFGKIFRVTTWGESHGKAVGAVIDGCPAGIPLTEDWINQELAWRAPGNSPYTSPRKEEDKAEIYSGVFEGKTTGAPISLLIPNRDADSSKYEPIKDLYRPGHANYPYLQKYGIFDYRGGGRASARETAARVAAGAVAKAVLHERGVDVVAYIKEIGGERSDSDPRKVMQKDVHASPLFCPDKAAVGKMTALLEKTKDAGDSLGGVVEFVVRNLPAGVGDPVYDKLEAVLAKGMMGLPASKGFEIGAGFHSAVMRGSENNDPYSMLDGKVVTETNHAGGVVGGISNGMPIVGRVAFKPPSSIKIAQKTVNTSGEQVEFSLPEGSRHDPCVAIRAVPVVEAMAALSVVDALLYAAIGKFGGSIP